MSKRLTVKEKNEALASKGKQLRHYGFILRIKPTEEQQQLINQTFGCVRLVYNQYLDARQVFYKEHGKNLSVYQYKKEVLNPMKRSDEYSFLREVDKFALENALQNVQDAYERFFKGQNRFPQFKSKRSAKKAYTSNVTNDNIRILDRNQLQLPKLGPVKMARVNSKRNKNILSKLTAKDIRIIKATVYQKGARYYVSLVIEEVIEMIKPLEICEIDLSRVAGVDLGLKAFATVYDGDKTTYMERANYIKESEKKLAKLQRRLAKKQVNSQNFKKAQRKVSALQEHISNQRKDFAHKKSHQLANENQVVVLETLNIKGMVKNRKLAKAIADAGWYQFTSYLKYKLEWQGKHLVQIDRWYASSKTCSSCGEKNNSLKLNERRWRCNHCGTLHERDENAAMNIRNKGLEALGILSVA